MIRAVVTGRLHGEPKQRTGQSGKPFATAGAWVDVGGDESVWCSLIAFGSASERLLQLRPGDAAAFSGRLTPKLFDGREGARVSLDMAVDEIAAVRRKPKAEPGTSASHAAFAGGFSDDPTSPPAWMDGERRSARGAA